MLIDGTEVASGPRMDLKLNGRIVGIVTDVRITRQVAMQEVVGLGDMDPKGHEPTGRSYALSFGTVTILTKTLQELGLVDSGDDIRAIVKSTGYQGVLLDKAENGKTIARLEGVRITNEDFSFQARGLMTSNAQGVARKCTFAYGG